MKPGHVEVTIKHVMPTANGCAVFLGNDAKCFVIYVDHFVGAVIQMTIDSVKKERPLTHDLIGHILLGFGAQIERVIINDTKDSAFFARLHLSMKNELGQKILELDARPSDSIVLALQHKRPIHVTRPVFDAVEDSTEILERVLKQQEDAETAGDTIAKTLFPGIDDGEEDEDEDEDEDDDGDEDADEDDDEETT
jgi:bifunctional DNase/RNase